MIKILHLSDIHLGSSLNHGKINPLTGLNTRFEDFVKSLRLCIDRAINDPVDVVLFGGDAFPDSTPAPYIQEAFATEFRRLADANIPTILLIGNHDQHSQGVGGASLSIYRTLVVPNFKVGEKIETHLLSTKNGQLQVITLPWLSHSAFLTRPETEGLSMEAINKLLITKIEAALDGEIRALNPEIPTVFLAHLMAERCSLGAERTLSVGKGFSIPFSILTRCEFDYVALGHVHKHQNLNLQNNPPVIYAGSIERVDFSEEKEDKGYVIVELEKNKAKWEFVTLPTRPFLTIEIDVSQAEHPQELILKTIKNKEINDAVVRLIYKLRSEQLEFINHRELGNALKLAHKYTIKAELVSQMSRVRLPELGTSDNILNPMDALKAYLNNRTDIKDLEQDILEAAKDLLNDAMINDVNIELDLNSIS